MAKPAPKRPLGPRVVTLDIETAPLESYHWGLWDQNIGLEFVQHDWSILSFSYKVLGEKKVQFRCTGNRGAESVRDDKELCEELWTVLDEADIVVTQNGKSFDIKRINSRLLFHGFQPYSPIKQIDTKVIAKKHFNFTSNRLEWMSEKFTDTPKSKHKKFPGFSLWKACLEDDAAAWAEMAIYNARDVEATEKLYLKMRPWVEGHPNVAAYHEMDAFLCPKCGSSRVQQRGKALTQSGEYHRFQCQACGGWSRSRYTMNSTSKRKSLLSN